MKILSVLICLLCAGTSTAIARPPDMTLDYTWVGTPLCTPTPRSPEFQVDNAPSGTLRLRFVLLGPTGREFGGADVPLPARGTIPRGAVSYRPPCVGGVYTWTVEAIDADGNSLAQATLSRPFY